MNSLAAIAPRKSLTDRLNPILVKEVRQALRGRYFKVMFWLTLGVATLSGLLVVATGASSNEVEGIGQVFFMVMFGCMSAAVHAFTPFSAFLSTSAEWDENTHDLLVLSNLGPRQIVLGKLLSALIQGLLYYSTFGPFLVFAFLLNGIDLLTISVLLVCSVATCVGLSLVGIALASLARLRAARGILMAIFGAGLVMAWGFGMAAAGEISFSPQDLRSQEGQMGVAMFLTFVLVVGGSFGILASARFAHDEENRSTGLRIFSTFLVLAAGAWGAYLHAMVGEEETAWGMQVGAACVLSLAWLHFFSEPDGLGRRTGKHVTGKRWLALLSIPFLPGGGRGILLFFVHFLLALTCGVLALQTGARRDGFLEVVGMLSVFYAYLFVFLGLPSAVGRRLGNSDRARMLTRIATLVLVALTILGPGIAGLVLGIPSWMGLRHPFNPVWVMEQLERSGSTPSEVEFALVGLTIGILLTLALNAARIAGGASEVVDASTARRLRAASDQT